MSMPVDTDNKRTRKVRLLIDSGAASSVCGETFAPHCKAKLADGKEHKYKAVTGETVRTMGTKRVLISSTGLTRS